ncbi:MAG TPA: zf-HC2 domain-containing protein [Acidimicrobiales bacterium]|jgi:anti-sigma-K factor RskA|nr:zf-HC2 domain-containing protein [Acidimicrobiales bacterium]
MNDDMNARGCEEHQNELPELALGVLTGRDRARALAHVDSCARCAEELEQLSRAADAVVQAAPSAEPPMGFEVRLFERMGVTDMRRRSRLRPPRWAVGALSAAAAVIALAVGLSLGLSSSTPPSPSAAPPNDVVTANLVEHGTVVGRVATHGGEHPWMWMMLVDSNAQGTVDCIVVTSDGVSHQVGTFEAKKGYGAWVAPLAVNPKDIRSAEVVAPSGTVIATAALG